jgi:hypothetical protein
MQRNLLRLIAHQREIAEELSMTRDIIQRMRASVRRKYTKRQVKPLSQTGILTTRDANRSIKTRKEENLAKEERKQARRFKKVYGYKLFSGQLQMRKRLGRQESFFFIDN